jgi:dTDP-4-amino-4,6-dideoxygalactose transaminase
MHVPFVDLSRIHTPIKKELDAAWNEVTTANNFILGDQVSQFEEQFADYTGGKFAIGLANGSDALLLSLLGLGIGKGDEVIVPSHTFISTALAVTYAGATPVFAEIEADSYLLDPHDIEARITKKTKAIIPVSLYGQPVDFSELETLAKKYGIALIIDDCQAHGASYRKKPLGKFGDVQAYSMYPGKNLGAFGDGGMAVTNNKKLADNIRLLRNIGRTGWYEHPVKGYNSRLDTLQAAILLAKLPHLDTWNRLRQEAAARYNKLLADLPITLPVAKTDRSHIYHLYIIRTKKRKEFMEYMLKHDVHVSIHYPIPIHLQKAYQELPKVTLPVTEKIAKEIVSLPLFPGITEKEQEYVAKTIKQFFSASK